MSVLNSISVIWSKSELSFVKDITNADLCVLSVTERPQCDGFLSAILLSLLVFCYQLVSHGVVSGPKKSQHVTVTTAELFLPVDRSRLDHKPHARCDAAHVFRCLCTREVSRYWILIPDWYRLMFQFNCVIRSFTEIGNEVLSSVNDIMLIKHTFSKSC